jgi:choline dehydrogenase-like flavoprotein
MSNFGNLHRDGFLGNLSIHGKEVIDRHGNVKCNSVKTNDIKARGDVQVKGDLNVEGDIIITGQTKQVFESRVLTTNDCARRATNGAPSEQYDIVICGAGTAGSLLVYRLAQQFPTAKILVLEAGKDDVQDDAIIRTPQDGPNPNDVTDDWGQIIRGPFSALGEGAQAIQQTQRSTTNDQVMPQQKILGMARGITLGGTSAIHAQVWNRGTKQGTYDKWEAATNSSDFGWDAMNNSLKAIENRSQNGRYYGQPIPLWQAPAAPLPPSYKFNPLYHGDNGRIMLFQGQLDAPLDSAVLAVAGGAGFGGRVLQINLDAEDPNNPSEYASPTPTSEYSQSDTTFSSFNPYPLTTPGATYTPPGPGGVSRGPEYAGIPQKLGGAALKKSYKARCFAAPAYIYPLQYPVGTPLVPNNVTIKTKVYVTKLIFDNPEDPLECTGVEYVENGWHVANVARAIRRDVKPWINTFSNVDRSTCTPEQAKINQAVALSGGIKKAYAKTDVWLCMGALDSPAILQRSGVGPREVLENLNYSPVECILNLPGVGRGVQDSCDMPIAAFHEIDYNTYLPAYTGAPASAISNVYESIFGLADPTNPANAQGTSSISGAPTRATFGGTRLRLKSSPNLDYFDFDALIIDIPTQFIPFGNELWADLASLLSNTPSTIDTLNPTLSIANFDRSVIGQYNGNGSVETIPTFICANEFWNAQSKGEVVITSGNVFDRPNYAPNMLANENDLESFENFTRNNIIPLMTKMASQKFGPRGPFTYAYVIGTAGHVATTTDVQLSPSVAASLFKPFAPAYHISQGDYDTPNSLVGAVITIASGAAAIPGNNQRVITAWSGNTGIAATSYVATVNAAFAGLPVALDQYALALATELPLDTVQFNGDNNRNFVRFLPAQSDNFFSDINKQTLGATPFTTSTASTRIIVHAVGHNLAVGEYIKISGVTAPVDTIQESEFNNYHVVDTVLGPDDFSIVLFWNKTARPGTPGSPAYPSPAASATGGSFGNTGVIVHTLAFNRIKFREFLFHAYFSGWHPASSCRMGPPDNSSSVVDTRARVYNTLGLRVCDASILPTKPDANTQAPIYGIAQRITELVIPEYQTLL